MLVKILIINQISPVLLKPTGRPKTSETSARPGLQHWRAILSRSKGSKVSSNVAPATATASVVSNKSFALAYKGANHGENDDFSTENDDFTWEKGDFSKENDDFTGENCDFTGENGDSTGENDDFMKENGDSMVS